MYVLNKAKRPFSSLGDYKKVNAGKYRVPLHILFSHRSVYSRIFVLRIQATVIFRESREWYAMKTIPAK